VLGIFVTAEATYIGILVSKFGTEEPRIAIKQLAENAAFSLILGYYISC
jgi:hypothetical protein